MSVSEVDPPKAVTERYTKLGQAVDEARMAEHGDDSPAGEASASPLEAGKSFGAPVLIPCPSCGRSGHPGTVENRAGHLQRCPNCNGTGQLEVRDPTGLPELKK